MVLADGRVFVTNRSNLFLLVVDPQTDAVADTVVVGFVTNFIWKKGAEKVPMLRSSNGANATALKLNPSSLAIAAVFSFSAGVGQGRLNKRGGGDTLFYLQEYLFRIPVRARALPTTSFISANGRTF